MKNLVVLLACLCLTNISVAQQTYAIQSLGSEYTTVQINEAFASANFCGMYYSSERRELSFEDGTIIELLSAAELPNMDASCFIARDTANDSNIWRISADGYLIRTIQTPSVKQ